MPEIKNIISNIYRYTTIKYIHFLGGEPLVREDFFELASYLNTMNIAFGFNTNGLLLNKNSIDKLLSNPFLTNIVLSLEGPDEQTNDFIRGKRVFNIAYRNIKQINEFKKQNPSCTMALTINCVVTSHNYTKIPDMVYFCNGNNIDSLNFLQFIESGNAVDKGLSVSPSMHNRILIDLSNVLSDKTIKTQVNPKFARPLARDFLNRCYDLDFPSTTDKCNAGADFAFIDNIGNLYSCNLVRDYSNQPSDNSLIKNDFLSIWTSKEFDIPFSKYYASDTYEQLHPCNKCKYLYNECFPCYLSLEKHGKGVANECERYVEEAQKMGVDILNG